MKHIIVFERDPLVRDDISETLTHEFPDCTLRLSEHPRDFQEWIGAGEDLCFAILSVPDGCAPSEVEGFVASANDVGSVVIANAPNGTFSLPPHCYYIQRPFSSETLIHGIKTVLSSLPERQS